MLNLMVYYLDLPKMLPLIILNIYKIQPKSIQNHNVLILSLNQIELLHQFLFPQMKNISSILFSVVNQVNPNSL